MFFASHSMSLKRVLEMALNHEIALKISFPNLYRSPSESSYSPEHIRKRDASISALGSADLVLRLDMIICYHCLQRDHSVPWVPSATRQAVRRYREICPVIVIEFASLWLLAPKSMVDKRATTKITRSR